MPILVIFLKKIDFFAVNQHKIEISCQQCFGIVILKYMTPGGTLGGLRGGKWAFLGISQKMAILTFFH